MVSSLIPNVLISLVNKAKDSNDSSFQISDVIGAISGENCAVGGGITNAILKYSVKLGLVQDGNGQVSVSDAIAAVT